MLTCKGRFPADFGTEPGIRMKGLSIRMKMHGKEQDIASLQFGVILV